MRRGPQRIRDRNRRLHVSYAVKRHIKEYCENGVIRTPREFYLSTDDDPAFPL